MHLLYGVVGEGMGHATRSRVILDHLHASGHDLSVVASGRAHSFLSRRFADHPRMRFHEIHGLHLRYDGNALDLGRSILSNLGDAPRGIARNIDIYREVTQGEGEPQAVISDFESWAFFYGLNHYLPVISIDNMQIINRCTHPPDITGDPSFQLAKAAVKVKLPGAFHYLVTTFFFPPVRKDRTTLIPPILRPEIRAARREPGSHVLVYQTAPNDELVPFLQSLPGTFVVYGSGREGEAGNVRLQAFSEIGFIDHLRTARAVVAGGGFSLMSECVHLGIPLYSVPVAGQYEQELNARYLAALSYGAWSPTFDHERIADWLSSVAPETSYVPTDESMIFSAVDSVLASLP